MTNQPLSKRTLEEADPNSEVQPTSTKYLKKTNDGEENEEATEWYASLTHDDLKKLCTARGTRTIGGSRLQLIEYAHSSLLFSLPFPRPLPNLINIPQTTQGPRSRRKSQQRRDRSKASSQNRRPLRSRGRIPEEA